MCPFWDPQGAFEAENKKNKKSFDFKGRGSGNVAATW